LKKRLVFLIVDGSSEDVVALGEAIRSCNRVSVKDFEFVVLSKKIAMVYADEMCDILKSMMQSRLEHGERINH
jgi:hypothetical protein